MRRYIFKIVVYDNYRRTEQEQEASSFYSNMNWISLHGFIITVIVYFQIEYLLRVKFQGNKVVTTTSNEITQTFFKIFDSRYTMYQGMCPSSDLTFPPKHLITFGNLIRHSYQFFIFSFTSSAISKYFLYLQ